ncbi:hypothetical protein BN946_scf185007.g207 [Trametes cinnabarina]|uniref:Uncharacterized protein n=1 Tax=Pycnoporus cinnabarinus TaxID=5643 RepID=A0A060SF48_PYCCI|nr:hypothetical protein BN946_scf185007.g207 [Trametes cinnabarina]
MCFPTLIQDTCPLRHSFAKGSGAKDSSSWLSGLTRVESDPTSPPIQHKSPAPSSSPASAPEREDLHALVREQRRTIEALESEKTSLSERLHDLSQLESSKAPHITGDDAVLNCGPEFHHTQELLQAEHTKTENLEKTVREVREHAEQLSHETQKQRETIAALEAEKATLAKSTAQRYAALEQKAKESEKVLADERTNASALRDRIHSLQLSVREYEERVEQQQQTISLLVSEKASLSSSVERLESAESALKGIEEQLEKERSKAATLQERLSHLEADAHVSQAQIAQLSATERELTDKSRDQEREIQLLNGRVHELQTQSEEHLRRVHELEEQIESDDRAERLEETLKNTQDRADELEFQLSKLRQAYADLQGERETIAEELHRKTQAETEWQARHAEAEKQHSMTQMQLSSVIAERDSLAQERSTLQAEVDDGRNLVAELQQKLAALSSELSLNTRQMKQMQAELRTATTRAEDAEKTQKELQAEGVGLMRSLEEMRPKIVELTDAKLALSEKVDSLETTIQSRDAVIAQLRTSIEELRREKESVEGDRDRLQAALDAERSALEKDSTELQQAYSELQTELARARKSVQDLEDERDKLRQLSNSNVEEIRRLTDSVHTQSSQLSSLRGELGERIQALTEAQEFLESAQTEMESLRAELVQKDEELDRLREDVSNPSSRAGTQSLDEEMLNALKQQHALELSEAQSQVRALEDALFKSEAQVHTLQRQIAMLEDELAHLRTAHPRPSSRGSTHQPLPRRTSSRTIDRSDDLRRASLGSQRPPSFATPQPSSTFEGLSPETRHKRKVSLSMLKARIDSELAASTSTSRPSSRNSRNVSSPAHRQTALPVVVEPPSQPATPPPAQVPKRPVFMDESHIFWCHSCQGDLVVL